MELFNIERDASLLAAEFKVNNILCRGQMFKGSACGWSEQNATTGVKLQKEVQSLKAITK